MESDQENGEGLTSEEQSERKTLKSIRSKVKGLGGKALWRKASAGYQQLGSAMHMSTLAWWWKECPVQSDDSIRMLFDFETGPISFARDRPARQPQAPAGRSEEPKLPGLKVQQDVFLTYPKGCRTDRQLDDFATAITSGTDWDGVTCIAGFRGSGKSTVLNRIEWFCKNQPRDGAQPLLVRFDIGMSFEHERFARDVADQLCRASRLHCKEGPFKARIPGVTAVNLLLGNFARWCHGNIMWAGIVFLIVVSLIGISQLHGSTPVSLASKATTSGGLTLLDKEFPIPVLGKISVADLHAIVLVLSTILMLGLAHGVRSLLPQSLSRQRPNWRQYLVIILLAPPLAVGLDALWVWSVAEATAPRTAGCHLMAVLDIGVSCDNWLGAILTPFLGSMVPMFLAILALPGWWEHFVYSGRMTRQLRAQDDARFIPLPYVGTLLAQVLPKGHDVEELDKISMPFLQQRTKEILNRCAATFGRVVILVDDADVLPSDQFHLLMRILRPISKVRNVSCVIAVPEFFFDVFKSAKLGDAHSTIRECHFLGNPAIYSPGYDEPFKLKSKLTRSNFHDQVVELLRSRLRSPLADGTTAQLKELDLFVAALTLWDFDPKADAGRPLRDHEKFFLKYKGLSRREWIREIELRLPGPMPLKADLGSQRREDKRGTRLERYRRDFEGLENVFHCNVRRRADSVKAEGELDGRTAATKQRRAKATTKAKRAKKSALRRVDSAKRSKRGKAKK